MTITDFITARLNDFQAGTEDDPAKDDGGRCEYLLGWHLEPNEVRQLVGSLRSILTEHEAVAKLLQLTGGEQDRYRDWILRQLAAIWADHPDYQPEWAPEPEET